MQHQPTPPFTYESAVSKVRAAEDAWNSRDPDTVAQACTEDSVWRVRDEALTGRDSIREFLRRKWAIELHYQLMTELWSYTSQWIFVRFEYEWQHGETGQWYRTHGNELWEFDADGYIAWRDMCAKDIPIAAADRRIGR